MAEAQAGYGTGKRKGAVAKVQLQSGSGEIIVNDKPLNEYVHRYSLNQMVREPFRATDTVGQYDVDAEVLGGGIVGQAGALRHGIAKTLVKDNEEFRTILSQAGLLTRDARVKERKHAGFRKARRAKQFSKR